jgi:phage terminase large subunit-like protein
VLHAGAVLNVEPIGRSDVYDLSVEDQHEFFASGVLVHNCWGDEVGLWVKWKVAFDESIYYAVRETPAKILLTGTPKRTLGARQLIKRLLSGRVRASEGESVISLGDVEGELGGRVLNVQLFTEENIENLDPESAADFMSAKGTSLERQELMGELLDEVEGALMKLAKIEETRLHLPRNEAGREESPFEDDPFFREWIFSEIDPTRIAVAVDPAVSFSEDSDQHGIVVVAKARNSDLYVLEDASCRCPVTEWPKKVMDLVEKWQADRVIGEVNNGGDYIETQLRAAGYMGGVEIVHASRGKEVRAGPVATYWEQGHVHIVDHMPELEAQWATWIPGEKDAGPSPDNLDAMVYGCAWLVPRLATGWASVYRPAPTTPADAEEAESDAEGVPKRGWGSVYATQPKDPFEHLRAH